MTPWDQAAFDAVIARNGNQAALPLGAPSKKPVAAIPGAPALPERKVVVLKPGEWFEFIVEGDPVAKGRPRRVENPGQKPRTITPRRTEQAEKLVADTAILAGCPRLEGHVELEVWFYLGTKRKTDGDNLFKLVTDALNPKWKRDKKTKLRVLARPGIAYEDDVQIADGHYHKRIDRVRPRTVVRIRNPSASETL